MFSAEGAHIMHDALTQWLKRSRLQRGWWHTQALKAVDEVVARCQFHGATAYGFLSSFAFCPTCPSALCARSRPWGRSALPSSLAFIIGYRLATPRHALPTSRSHMPSDFPVPEQRASLHACGLLSRRVPERLAMAPLQVLHSALLHIRRLQHFAGLTGARRVA